MKTTSTYVLTPILLPSMSLFCFGAEDELAKKMTGRWQDLNGEYGVLEFFADGSFAMEIRMGDGDQAVGVSPVAGEANQSSACIWEDGVVVDLHSLLVNHEEGMRLLTAT